MSQPRQAGYSLLAMQNGYPNGNLQCLLLGYVDRLPHLIWQSAATGEWSQMQEPFETHEPLGYSAISMCKGSGSNLYVLLLDERDHQPFIASQSAVTAAWTGTRSLWTLAGKDPQYPPVPYGFTAMAMAQGNGNNLQMVLLGEENHLPYLFWQSNADGTFHGGNPLTAPSVTGGFKALAMARGNADNLQVVLIGADGVPYLIWQSTNGTWYVGGSLWSYATQGVNEHTGGFAAVTMARGNSNNLQVVLLGKDGYPYLFWQGSSDGIWRWSGAMTNSSGETYKALAWGQGRTGGTNYLSVGLLAYGSGQLYQLYQDPLTGHWVSYDDPIVDATATNPEGFASFAMLQGNYEQHLDVVLVDARNHLGYLAIEHDPLGIQQWEWQGMLPTDPFLATLTPTPPLSVNGVLEGAGVTPRSTPGNVGVCLSGGGSRALVAGMGQLRGLQQAQANGQTLLSQVKAISTVSGGSWLGMPYCFNANSHISDKAFLGDYVAPAAITYESLSLLPAGNAGNICASEDFGKASLLSQASYLVLTGVPLNIVWQVTIGYHVLSPYRLYDPGAQGYPSSTLTYDSATRSAIREDNPGLANESINLVADQADPSRIPRPFPICNMTMEVTASGGRYFANVQGNPFFTGIVGSPQASDANGLLAGGGGVTTFAFSSIPVRVQGTQVEIQQPRPWSLTDLVGVSSGFLAAGVWEYLEDLARTVRSPDELRARLEADGPGALERVRPLIPTTELEPGSRRRKLDYHRLFLRLQGMAGKRAARGEGLSLPMPVYDYWPVRNARPAGSSMSPSEFADGGYLENTGVAAMLTYSDIDSIISFINSSTELAQSTYGVVDAGGNMIPNTNILINGQVPPLFGYQPYDDDAGYVPFSRGSGPNDDFLRYVQVFPSESFAPLLQGLWSKSGEGRNTSPATFTQRLQTVQNDWFGVTGGRAVTMVWAYMNFVSSWSQQLQPDVLRALDDVGVFPYYSTYSTELSRTQVNLLAGLTSWCVADPSNSAAYQNLFV